MIASTTWSLTEMCKTHLKFEREDYDPDETASRMDSSVSSPETMLKFVRHCDMDAHLQMAIATKVQILPLTKQLTNLAGNSWWVNNIVVDGIRLQNVILQEQNAERRTR